MYSGSMDTFAAVFLCLLCYLVYQCPGNSTELVLENLSKWTWCCVFHGLDITGRRLLGA
jgi:hypothetical protein